jgi:MFS family permease
VVTFFITVVVGLAAALLWSLVAGLLMRLFGARLPLLPFTKPGKRALKRLTFSQSVCFGVLAQGCGMFIAMTLFEYLSWRFWHVPSKDFSMTICVYAVLWPLVGLFTGLLHAGENRNRRTSLELSSQGLKEVSDWDENGFSK